MRSWLPRSVACGAMHVKRFLPAFVFGSAAVALSTGTIAFNRVVGASSGPWSALFVTSSVAFLIFFLLLLRSHAAAMILNLPREGEAQADGSERRTGNAPPTSPRVDEADFTLTSGTAHPAAGRSLVSDEPPAPTGLSEQATTQNLQPGVPHEKDEQRPPNPRSR